MHIKYILHTSGLNFYVSVPFNVLLLHPINETINQTIDEEEEEEEEGDDDEEQERQEENEDGNSRSNADGAVLSQKTVVQILLRLPLI